MLYKKPPPSRAEAALLLDDEPGVTFEDPTDQVTVALSDQRFEGAFHERIDETAPRFPPDDDHHGRVCGFR